MSKQSDKKVIDRIINYPHKEKGCSYVCGRIGDTDAERIAWRPIPPYIAERGDENL